jgi:hypothetical protein
MVRRGIMALTVAIRGSGLLLHLRPKAAVVVFGTGQQRAVRRHQDMERPSIQAARRPVLEVRLAGQAVAAGREPRQTVTLHRAPPGDRAGPATAAKADKAAPMG